MKRSSDYNDLLLKTFIRESFIQHKREDLFERKNQNLISENKKRLIKEQKVINEVLTLIENFENKIENIILESSSRYSIKNILLEKRYYPNPKRKELSFLTDMYKNEDPLSFDFTQETKKLEKMWNQHVEEYKRDKIDPYIMPGTTTKLDPEAAKEYFIHSHREKSEGRTVMQWMRDNKTLIYRLLFLPMCLSKLGVHQGNLMHKLGGGEKLDPEVVKLLEPTMKTAPDGKVKIDKDELKRVTGADDQEVEKVVKEIEETSDKIQEKAKEEPKAKKSVVEKIKQKAKKAAKKVKEKIKKVKEKVKKAEQQPKPSPEKSLEDQYKEDMSDDKKDNEITKQAEKLASGTGGATVDDYEYKAESVKKILDEYREAVKTESAQLDALRTVGGDSNSHAELDQAWQKLDTQTKIEIMEKLGDAARLESIRILDNTSGSDKLPTEVEDMGGLGRHVTDTLDDSSHSSKTRGNSGLRQLIATQTLDGGTYTGNADVKNLGSATQDYDVNSFKTGDHVRGITAAQLESSGVKGSHSNKIANAVMKIFYGLVDAQQSMGKAPTITKVGDLENKAVQTVRSATAADQKI